MEGGAEAFGEGGAWVRRRKELLWDLTFGRVEVEMIMVYILYMSLSARYADACVKDQQASWSRVVH